jgi:hypothetical protein
VPNFVRTGAAQCDGAGNVYFAVTSPEYAHKYILRVSSDGQDAHPFLLPIDLATGVGAWKFYVDTAGTLYELFSTYADIEKHILIEVSSSGEEIRRVTWQVPKDFSPSSFAVGPDGRAMVSGEVVLPGTSTTGHEAPLRAFHYTAWLDPNGHVVHELGLGSSERKDSDFSSTYNHAAVTVGRPGTYLSISSSTINTYGTDGSLLHSSSIVRPSKDAILNGIQYVDGQAAVSFYVVRGTDKSTESDDPPLPLRPFKSDPDAPKVQNATVLQDVWEILDPVEGTSHGFFQLTNSFRGSGICYLGSEDFLYFTVVAGRPTFVQAHPQ